MHQRRRVLIKRVDGMLQSASIFYRAMCKGGCAHNEVLAVKDAASSSINDVNRSPPHDSPLRIVEKQKCFVCFLYTL